MKFLDDYNNSKWNDLQAKTEIVKRIEDWRNQPGEATETIWEFLGLTKQQYLDWVDKGILPEKIKPLTTQTNSEETEVVTPKKKRK